MLRYISAFNITSKLSIACPRSAMWALVTGGTLILDLKSLAGVLERSSRDRGVCGVRQDIENRVANGGCDGNVCLDRTPLGISSTIACSPINETHITNVTPNFVSACYLLNIQTVSLSHRI